MSRFSLQARYVLPLDGRPPIEGGLVTVEDKQIVAVGENNSGKPAIDLGDVALIPGLVNAHTHLEFSHLASPLGSPGQSLPNWIRDVLAYRMQYADTPDPESAIIAGLKECVSSGTTTVGEISTQPVQLETYAGLEVVVYAELLGLPIERLPALKERAASHLTAFANESKNLLPGLSPHAPYSVHPEIVRLAAELSASSPKPFPVAMHLAESPEEIELLRGGTGPFMELLEERGVWQPSAIPPGTRPLDYLKMLSRAARALVVHGNYLERDELEYLANHRGNMTLVYCPRTHAYFGHQPYPLQLAFDLGVSLAIGTDSRASNPDLSLLTELRFLAQRFSAIPMERILQMGTTGGAKALGLEASCGALSSGKLANLTAIEISAQATDPYKAILHGSGGVRQTWVRGKSVYCQGH